MFPEGKLNLKNKDILEKVLEQLSTQVAEQEAKPVVEETVEEAVVEANAKIVFDGETLDSMEKYRWMGR